MTADDMRRPGWNCIAVVLLLAVSAGLTRAETLTVATYNIENYGVADRMTEEGYRREYPKPEPEKRALRSVIRAINADVLVLQEVGPVPFFRELVRDLKAEGLEYAYGYLLEAADPDRHLAVLSRRPFRSVRPHADLRFTYCGAKVPVKRGLLEISVSTEAGPLTLFGVHLKSRFTDRADDPNSALRRLGEATVIRDEILSIFSRPADESFLILGDCNDAPNSKPVRRFERRGGTRISKLLPAVDDHGETWTHRFQKEDSYSRVDHILVSARLADAVVDGCARIGNHPAVRAASDHRPVVVVLDLKPDASSPKNHPRRIGAGG